MENVCQRFLRYAKIDTMSDPKSETLPSTQIQFDLAKILVEAGANIHENNGLGTTPLMFATIFGNTQIVEYLNKQDKNRSFKSKIYLLLSKFISLFKKNK